MEQKSSNMADILSNRLNRKTTARGDVQEKDDQNFNKTINFQDSQKLTSEQRKKILVTITSQQTPSGTSNNLTGTEKSFRLKFKKATQGEKGSVVTPFETRIFGGAQTAENAEGTANMSVFSASKDDQNQDPEDSNSYKYDQENDAFRKKFFDVLKAENRDNFSVGSAISAANRTFFTHKQITTPGGSVSR